MPKQKCPRCRETNDIIRTIEITSGHGIIRWKGVLNCWNCGNASSFYGDYVETDRYDLAAQMLTLEQANMCLDEVWKDGDDDEQSDEG